MANSVNERRIKRMGRGDGSKPVAIRQKKLELGAKDLKSPEAYYVFNTKTCSTFNSCLG